MLAVVRAPTIFHNDWFCTRISNFFQSPLFSIARIEPEKMKKTLKILSEHCTQRVLFSVRRQPQFFGEMALLARRTKHFQVWWVFSLHAQFLQEEVLKFTANHCADQSCEARCCLRFIEARCCPAGFIFFWRLVCRSATLGFHLTRVYMYRLT